MMDDDDDFDIDAMLGNNVAAMGGGAGGMTTSSSEANVGGPKPKAAATPKREEPKKLSPKVSPKSSKTSLGGVHNKPTSPQRNVGDPSPGRAAPSPGLQKGSNPFTSASSTSAPKPAGPAKTAASRRPRPADPTPAFSSKDLF
jgi:hypothetical protein